MTKMQSYLVLLAAIASGPAALAGDYYINVSSTQSTGNIVRGPAIIRVRGINRIGQDATILVNTTFSAGPSLAGLPFIPSVPSSPAPPGGAAHDFPALRVLSLAGNHAADLLRKAAEELNAVALATATLTGDLNVTIAGLNDAATQVRNLSSVAHQVLAGGGEKGPAATVIKSEIITPANTLVTTLNTTILAAWPYAKIAPLTGRLAVLRNTLTTLPSDASDWTTWAAASDNKLAYSAIVTQVSDLATTLANLSSPTNASLTSFETVRNQLTQWIGTLRSIGASGPEVFGEDIPVTCSFSFNNSKDSKVQLVTTDRFASPATPVTKELVTVSCSSPLSVSAGFGFSTMQEKNVVFVSSAMTDSAGKPESVFGYQALSSFRPMPILLLNTRVWEPNDWFSLHLSAGAGVNLKTGQVGTDVDYLFGPSLTFRRTLFLTPGLHVGRVAMLSRESGFTIGGVVPVGLSAPPIQQQWSKAFVLAVTWKIK